MREERSLEEMYGEDDLSQYPMFQGGFINFGFWKGIGVPFSKEKRIQSSLALYEAVFENLKLTSSDRVLEVGCGRGQGLRALHSRFHPLRLVGVDGSPAQIQRCVDAKVPAELVFARAERLPFPPQQFTKIYSVEALQHFTDPGAFLSEAYRLLEADGDLVVATFFLLGESHLPQLEKLIPTVRQKIDRIVSINQIAKAIEKAGFSLEATVSIGEHVWEPLDQWLEFTFPADWGRNWLVAYQNKLLDYFILHAKKNQNPSH